MYKKTKVVQPLFLIEEVRIDVWSEAAVYIIYPITLLDTKSL